MIKTADNEQINAVVEGKCVRLSLFAKGKATRSLLLWPSEAYRVAHLLNIVAEKAENSRIGGRGEGTALLENLQ